MLERESLMKQNHSIQPIIITHKKKIKSVRDYFFIYGLLFLMIMFSACTKKVKQRHEQAKTHHRLALLELTNQNAGKSALRRALDQVKKAIEFHNKPLYRALEGTLLLQLGDVDQGRLCLQELLYELEADQKVSKGHEVLITEIKNNLACAQMASGNHQEALRLWQEIVQDRSYVTPEVALLNQSKHYFAQGDYDTSLRLAEEAITTAPHYVDAYLYAAVAALSLNKRDHARERLVTLMAIEPTSSLAKELLAKLESSPEAECLRM